MKLDMKSNGETSEVASVRGKVNKKRVTSLTARSSNLSDLK